MASQWPGSQKKKKKRKTRKKRKKREKREKKEKNEKEEDDLIDLNLVKYQRIWDPNARGPRPSQHISTDLVAKPAAPSNLVKRQRIWDPGARADPGAPAAARY